MDKRTPLDEIEANLVPIPEALARRRYRRADLRVDSALLAPLERFHQQMVEAGGSEDGQLVVNSCYRRRGTTCEEDYGGWIDRSDANGHWTGRSIDFSAAKTARSFFGKATTLQHRDTVRICLFRAGFRFPWYWKRKVGGRIKEHWHIGVEVDKWSQRRAYRENPPPWYS